MTVTQAPKIVVDHNETEAFVVDPSFFTRPTSGYAGTGIDTEVKDALKTYDPNKHIFFVYLTEKDNENKCEIDVCDRTELDVDFVKDIDSSCVMVPRDAY